MNIQSDGKSSQHGNTISAILLKEFFLDTVTDDQITTLKQRNNTSHINIDHAPPNDLAQILN